MKRMKTLIVLQVQREVGTRLPSRPQRVKKKKKKKRKRKRKR